jgi:import inner membrane translocase subunit TIM21
MWTQRHPFGSANLLRQISSSTSSRQQAKQQDAKQTQQQSVDSLEITEETFSAITDKIPQKPVGIVEGTSYTLLILGAFTVRPGKLSHAQ